VNLTATTQHKLFQLQPPAVIANETHVKWKSVLSDPSISRNGWVILHCPSATTGPVRVTLSLPIMQYMRTEAVLAIICRETAHRTTGPHNRLVQMDTTAWTNKVEAFLRFGRNWAISQPLYSTYSYVASQNTAVRCGYLNKASVQYVKQSRGSSVSIVPATPPPPNVPTKNHGETTK
jgi:hypothetical protein